MANCHTNNTAVPVQGTNKIIFFYVYHFTITSELIILVGSKRCLIAGSYQEAANLTCPTGQKINEINFASYGTPIVDDRQCGSFAINNSCHAQSTNRTVSTLCVGREWCSVKYEFILYYV